MYIDEISSQFESEISSQRMGEVQIVVFLERRQKNRFRGEPATGQKNELILNLHRYILYVDWFVPAVPMRKYATQFVTLQ
jgi:hypothetical protein